MSNYIKVKDHPDLVRDRNSNAILNTDAEALNKYREERERLLKVKNAVNEVETLRNDVNEIKEMLQLLLKREK
jgi:hypothetical protein